MCSERRIERPFERGVCGRCPALLAKMLWGPQTSHPLAPPLLVGVSQGPGCPAAAVPPCSLERGQVAEKWLGFLGGSWDVCSDGRAVFLGPFGSSVPSVGPGTGGEVT